MASLAVAEAAREVWSDYLQDEGALGISVQEPSPGGGYALVVYSQKTPAVALPSALGIRTAAGFTQVPLVWSVGAPFEPQ